MIDQLGIEVWQLVLLGVAAAVLISVFFSGDKTKPKLRPNAKPQATFYDEDIIRIVSAWSSFKKECIDAGLTEASSKVDAIFPLLIISDRGSHMDQVSKEDKSDVDTNGKDTVV
tara:strand:- start:839 stop:1180 length:342 start_codon:yes stop_codon:yes gene_type:complete